MHSKILLIIFLNLFLINLSFASNIVFVDLNFIINNSILGKNVIKKLDDQNKKNLDLLKNEQLILNNEKDEIDKTKNIISKEKLDEKIKIFNNKLQNFNKKQDLLSNEFKELRQTEMSKLINKINPIIEQYMIENKIDLMLKKDSIYISKTDYDASKAIIELIDKNISN